MRGPAAVAALGDRLAGVAARNDLSAAGLERLLQQDETAWLSSDGDVFYQEVAPADVTGEGSVAQLGAPPAYPSSQTFALHSRPGAARTIFLDFDGATVQGTAWNAGEDAIANGTHIGWDSDGAPSTFSTTEHGWIQEVWRQVAESYAPLEVDVTTAAPGQAALTRSSSSDPTYGSQVLITSSAAAKQQACGSCLGVAFLNTFDVVDSSGRYQPAWVFADNPRFDPMIVAQAATHEAGHNLGLKHDGRTENGRVSDYYPGTSSWGPVMGSARTRAISHFSAGDYPNATNQEDDYAVMQAHGLPLRTDDHGDLIGTANQLGARPSYAVSGVIGTRADTDVFAVNLPCATALSVAASGIGAQSTLDLSLTVLDAAGNQVGVSNPTSSSTGAPPTSTGMDAQVSLGTRTGTHYLRVDGVGNAGTADTTWSDYGSRGQYRLTSTGCPTTPATPVPSTSTPPAPAPLAPAPSTPTPTTAPPMTAAPKPATPTTAPPVALRPSAPVIRYASAGARRGPVTAVARWAAPARTGGASITKYRVRMLRLDQRGRITRTSYSAYLSPTTRSVTLRLPKGRHTFSVLAANRVGGSAWSRSSNAVLAR
jgi:hypothetical protein